MAQKKDTEEDFDENTSRQGSRKNGKNKKSKLKEETRYSIWGISFIVFALLIV